MREAGGAVLAEGTVHRPAGENWQLGRLPAGSGARLLLAEWRCGGAESGNHYVDYERPLSFEGYRAWLRERYRDVGRLNKAHATRHKTFDDVRLERGESVTVLTGCGEDRGDAVFWCADRSVWSNGGDTAILQDRHGNVVARWMYTDDA